MDLSADIIGTNQKNLSVIDHSWMNPNPPGYDNYPSDNNTVRVLPTLSELWRTTDVGFSMTPNQAGSLMGVGRAATDDKTVADVSREARKAAMSGMNGAELVDHLRGLFTSRQITAAKDELAEVANEVGLLGNVYVDVRAFSTLDEADKFMNKYRSRLARDMLFDPKTMNRSVVTTLASRYRKAAVSDVKYDADLFAHYKDHLVNAGRIPADFVIDSKDSLRKAFLHVMPKEVAAPAPEVQTRKLSQEEMSEGLRQMADHNASIQREAVDIAMLKVVTPVVAFVQENLSKGKTGKDLKEMIRLKFATEDIVAAGKFIALAISERGLTPEHLDERVAKGQISEKVGDALKVIGQKYPVKKEVVEEPATAERLSSFQPGSYYSPLAKVAVDDIPYRQKAFEALKAGIDPDRIYEKMATKISAEDAGRILSEALAKFNALPSGAVANRSTRRAKGPVESLTQSSPLPTEEEAVKEQKEVVSFFNGSGQVQVDITPEPVMGKVEISDLANSNGIDALLGG